jgi:hypothetical protein
VPDVDELAEIRATVKRHRELGREATAAAPALWADCTPKWLAKRWQRMGFRPGEVEAWLSVRCFSPWTAAELSAAGVTPEMAGQRTGLGRGSADTIAFKCSARRLSIVEALSSLGIPDLAGQQHLIDRSARLDDALARSTVALKDLHDAAAAGAVSPAEAGDAVFSVLTAIRQLASVLSALGRETYRPLAEAVLRDDDEHQDSAAGQALSFADALGALSADLLSVHAKHYQALAGGTMATSDFGLRVAHLDSEPRDPTYDEVNG